MWPFDRKPKKTEHELQVENILNTPIEQLLENVPWRYPLDLQTTWLVLKKCSQPIHFAKLHSGAFKASQHPEYNGDSVVTWEILNAIYADLCTSIVSALQKKDVSELRELHENLGAPWNDRSNSNERRLLQNRVEIIWKNEIRILFVNLIIKRSIVSDYQDLFNLCKEDDPIVLEIAKKINDLILC